MLYNKINQVEYSNGYNKQKYEDDIIFTVFIFFEFTILMYMYNF